MSVCFRAQYTKDEVAIREELIIKYIISLIKDAQRNKELIPYFFEYGIIDWAWPLRFVKRNQTFKGYKYYSNDAYNAVLAGQTEFRRDHYFPKIRLKDELLFSLNNPDIVSVRKVMETYGEVCVITKDEDSRLKNAGLNKKMPDGWRIGDDIFARYNAIGINLTINNRQWL